ncbi:hypothetical protein C483_07998 [Natrialba hulunbeirensis JCM 10989]|uniref:Uncharacterized protein n=1 Tax=Natrialba hulunbeirensis JCM 10989 TaxID=1227493 RepID=M0A229_9EURY|nr:hypothetical protein [Natrialba hulunbeirensis]ELY92381.1 hypothetical protein C483_07998 [Natrialba hulunbeirensis JCM 10989]
MQAKIRKETDDGYGVLVTDNNEIEHKIGICYDGEIDGHIQNGYPDKPAKRNHSEGEHIGHARKYAQYYVAQETEHDTIPWDLDADRFEDVRQALQSLSDDKIEIFFGDLLDQSLSHYDNDPNVDIGDTTRPHELPEDMIGSEGAVGYKQEIYLDAAGDIEAVSGIGIDYYVARGERRTVWHGDAPDREPDACVDITPAPLTDPAPFRDYLDYNLRCQVRDCYLMRGMEPPEEYKVLGHGQYRFTGKYDNFDLYPPYHLINADIPGYTHEFRPDLPITWEELVEMTDPGRNDSIYSQIKGALFSR